MKKRLLVLTCVLGISMLTACGATETVQNEAAENQVAESVVVEAEKYSAETITEATEEVVEESAEPETVVSTETAEENAESETEEMSDEDAMTAIQEILAQAQQEAMERAKKEAESQVVAPEKEYDFPEGYDSNKYTWRQTTADRDLYWIEGDKELIGKEFIGETFEEILQMAEDPTCDFDEANFWNATCFKGLTVKDTEYLVSKGYNVDQLINMIIENGVGNVYELNIW